MSSTRRRPPSPPPEPWSDGETSALLEAWGPRHLRARGGPLRPADWRACAAAVTSRRGQGRPRTVYQCKNRVDYLKKRLRADRKRPKGAPPPRQVAGWLDRLRTLLRLAPSAPPGFARGRGAAFAAPEVKVEEEEETGGSAHPLPLCWPPVPKRRRTAVSLLSPVTSSSGVHPEGGGGSNSAKVAATLDRLAGTYERVEAAKQREAGRLEVRRLEAIRDLEVERMRLPVDVAVANSVGIDDAVAASAGDL